MVVDGDGWNWLTAIRSTTDIKNHYEYVSRRRKSTAPSAAQSSIGDVADEVSDTTSESAEDANDMPRAASKQQCQASLARQRMFTHTNPPLGMDTAYAGPGYTTTNGAGFPQTSPISPLSTSIAPDVQNMHPIASGSTFGAYYPIQATAGAYSGPQPSHPMQLLPFPQPQPHFNGNPLAHGAHPNYGTVGVSQGQYAPQTLSTNPPVAYAPILPDQREASSGPVFDQGAHSRQNIPQHAPYPPMGGLSHSQNSNYYNYR